MLTRVFLYPRCATSVLATSSVCSAADGTTASSVYGTTTDSATAGSADSADSVTVCTADASPSMLLLAKGISDWWPIGVLLE